WVVPLGPNVDAFEKELESFVGRGKYVAALSSGTSAIHLALVALEVGHGDEVICQSFTFSASANPIVYQGATPVFVDSERDTWNINPELLETAIRQRISAGKKPKAIISVHLYGMPAKMDDILSIAAKYDIPVIEDAAEALGSEYDGKACGTFGQYGILSFNGNKMITTSGGGAVICPDEEAKKRMLFYATQAREAAPYYLHKEIGYNYRMSNICAGIGRGQMTALESHISHHRHARDMYAALLADTDGIEVHDNPSEKHNSNFWLTTITINPAKTGTDCDTVRKHLETTGVESRLLWKPMHTQPVFKDAPQFTNGVSEQLFSQGLCLPSGPCVSDEDLEFVVSGIKSCLKPHS
ncbi:MAG: DegT/DnrJ/EryC1/StrS family aminotransferase, partial [Bacteroidales bacterium]|nr:DegT/DnrJ/EryC1/StrS family aminotransferase [Bacteroidales bacterium]